MNFNKNISNIIYNYNYKKCNKKLPFTDDISNIIRDYYGLTLSFGNKLKDKIIFYYKNIPDTIILLLNIFDLEKNDYPDIEGIFTSKEKVIDYIVNKELEIYIKWFNKKEIFKDLKNIDTIYKLISVKWININKTVYIHEDYYNCIPLHIHKEPILYLTQDIDNIDEFFEIDIDPIYPLDKSIIDI